MTKKLYNTTIKEDNTVEVYDVLNDSITTKMDNIKSIYNLINNIEDKNVSNNLKYNINIELDKLIDNIENLYYNRLIKDYNDGKKKINDETEREIYMSRDTMEKFLPYMLMYNILKSPNLEDNADIDINIINDS